MSFSNTSNLTFVTSFVNVYDPPFENKDANWRFDRFRDIAESGIQMCVYAGADSIELLRNFAKVYPNIQIMRVLNIDETWVSQICKQYDDSITLPDHRNAPKDIPDYLYLINSKMEFMQDAIMKNPWNSTHFAWIDYSISYVFKNIPASQETLRILSQRTFAKKFLTIPGCWDKLTKENEPMIFNQVHWRFCGGFLLGDRDSILEFYDLYQLHFAEFMYQHKKLIWEVNFWAWLELNTDWRPLWYRADHNDSILHVSADVCSLSMRHLITKKTYDYPKFDTFDICQASYLNYNGRNLLNSRYVNYWYTPAGHCRVRHPENRIITRNMFSELDENLMPICFKEMNNPPDEELPSTYCAFHGLEDIRLYEHRGKLQFIATSINYSPTGRNRMIIGDYLADTQTYANCKVIQPPNLESWCEKNWIPLKGEEPVTVTEAESVTEGTVSEDYPDFIYKWYPMEIGSIVNGQLQIHTTYPINAPYFQRVRGSSVFVEWGEFLIGVVHFSEDIVPRHYFHMLVMLDRKTRRPLKYSQIFYFEKIGIEFCIGFTIRDSVYHFWISKNGRDPTLVMLEMDHLPFCFDF